MPYLTYTDATGQHHRFAIRKKLSTIGRSKSNDLAVDDAKMAPQHAHILSDGGTLMLSSLDPKAALVVNGRARRNYELRDGDILSLGDTEFTFDGRQEEAKIVESPGPPRPRKRAAPADDANIERLFRFSEKLLAGQPLGTLFKTLLDSVIAATGADKGFLLVLRDGEMSITFT